MRFFWLLISAIVLSPFAEAQDYSPVAREVLEYSSRLQPVEYAPFQRAEGQHAAARHSRFVEHQVYLQLDDAVIRQVQAEKPEFIEFTLPAVLGIQDLQVFRTRLFAGNYSLLTSSGARPGEQHQFAFYRGIVKNDPGSIVAITLVNSKVHILVSKGHSNYRIHEADHGQYVFYNDRDLKTAEYFGCMTEDPEPGEGKPYDPSGSGQHARTGNCVEIYFECDHESYLDNGSSVANTEAWVAALFNEVSILYANENVPLSISGIFVWDTPDIYQDQTSTSGALSEFMSHRNNTGFNGRLAHLLSTRALGGGIAYLGVLCSNSNNYAVSANLGTNIVPFPNYSWNVNVVAHEMGHNFGSPHTHACAWNNNNSQIDDCGNVWLNNNGQSTGSCFNPNNPIIPDDGSVMSYCHLNTGNGISFNVGFGPQPGDLIYDHYISASCNTGACTPPACVALSIPANGAASVSVNTSLAWENMLGADGYRLTIGTSQGSGNILNNQDVGAVTTYDPGQLPFSSPVYVLIVPYNNLGDASGCTTFSFTTEANVPPSCTELLLPADGATDINPDQSLVWAASSGYVLGYKLQIGTTPGGNDVMPETDLGNVTTYNPGALPPSSSIYVRITPYGTQGDTEGCPVESFTTNSQLVYCNSAGESVNFEWISSFQLGDYQKLSGAQTYSDFTTDTIELSAGSIYPVSITPSYGSASYPENYKVWIDLNKNGDFNDPGEQVFSAGPQPNMVTGEIQFDAANIPFNTRMRVSMKYNSPPAACETFQYGEVEDYTVRIVEGQGCGNLVTNTSSSGPGSFNAALGCAQPGDTIFFSPAISFGTIDLTQGSVVVDMPLTLVADPGSQVTIRGLQADRLFDVGPSGVLLINGLHLISGAALSGSAIQNAGITILQDVVVHPNPGLPPGALLIRNTGTLQIRNSVSVSGN